ncbi:TonB-dependent receptor [Maribacter sp. 2210JD10-5]|uniref:TonB-dependent receptor n=1 Tax=Maribacter sp. 2210JD10-5 TaxID=3386272 RepID=UPI0039BC9147
MKRQIFGMLILLCLGNFYNYAQESTISGKLTDSSSGETLFGVNVTVYNENRGVITNEYGFYSITLPHGSYKLLFSYMGFNTYEKEVELNEDLTLNIELEEVATELDEVVVLADDNDTKSQIKVPQMSVNKLSAKAIKQAPVVFGEIDLLKTITLLPGVNNANEGSTGFHVRGGAADQNLVLLDEATIYNTSHLFGFFSVFNADAVKDIKLYKGGIPARFGGRISSVLDVRQKDGNTKELHLNGGIGLISSRLMVEGPLQKDKSSFLVAGRTSYANLFLMLADEPNRASFYDLNTKLSYELDSKNKLFLSGYFGKDNLTIAEDFKNSYGNTSFNLRWNHLFGTRLFSNLSLIYSSYDYGLSFSSNGLELDSGITNFDLKYDFRYYLNNNLKLNFGLSAGYFNFNPGEVTSTGENSRINDAKLDEKYALEPSLYIGAEQDLAANLSIQYGIRLSSFARLGGQMLNTYANERAVIYDSRFDIYRSAKPNGEQAFDDGEIIESFFNLEPRLSLSYVFDNASSVKASYQRTNQYIHLISNTSAATPLDVWAPSGKFIEPQRSDQYGVGYFKNFKDDKFTMEIEGYYKTVDNRLDYIDGADLIANNNIETEILPGESRAYGLELLLKKNTGRLTGWLSYTLSKSEQRVRGRTDEEIGINNGDWYNTAYDRTHDISLTGNYVLNDKWSFGSNFIFQTGRPTNYASGYYDFDGYFVPVFTGRNEQRLPTYHRIDVSATLTPKSNDNRKWKGEWVFGLYNLYGRKNAASISFRNSQITLDEEPIYRNEAIKTWIFGIMPTVTYNFKF